MPDGVLFGTSNAHVETRKILIDKCKLEGVISMPSGVFKPYAGVSTAVLVFQKGGTTDNVWFYDMDADGFSLDDKRQKVTDNDIPDIVEKWKARFDPHPVTPLPNRERGVESRSKSGTKRGEGNESRKGKCFLVPAEEIRANKYDLSISRYKEIEHKEIEYDKPDVIMKKVMELEHQIENDVETLKQLLWSQC